MKRVLSVALALMFVWLVAQPAIVTQSAAATVAVTNVTLKPSSLKWAIGMSGKFTAAVSPSNASNKAVTWSSSNAKVAAISSTGVIVAKGIGSATITCASKSNPGKKATCAVTVTVGMPVTSVKLNVTTLKWPVGMTGTFKAYISPTNAISRDVSWKSSNTKVATIDSTGKIKSVGYGKATITCTSKVNPWRKATCSVTVGKALTSVKLNVHNLNWQVGKSGKFKATVAPADAISKALTWKSSDSSVASITSTGVILARKSGNAVITCSYKYNSKVKDTCKVVVTAPNPDNIVSYVNSGEGFFYVADDPWQRNWGFNPLYDLGAPVTAMYYNTERIKFTYGGKDWMIQIWKGQYGYAFIGCEIGVYTKKLNSPLSQHYDCASDADRLKMTMTMYQKDTFKFSREYKYFWWCTGFVPGSLDQYADRSELTMVARITFKDAAMKNAFVASLKSLGFTYAAKAGKTTPDIYTIRGNDVYFNWKNLGQPAYSTKVIFNSNGGTEVPYMRGIAGEKLIPPEDPTKDGFAFLGWDPALPDKFPTKQLKTTAKWGTVVSFDSNGGSKVAFIMGEVGTPIKYPANPTKEGYVFKGWDPAPVNFPDALNTTLKAKWAPTSSIIFNSNGGSKVASITGEEGTKVTAPANPTKTGTTFSGWTPEIPATFPADDLTVKAIWGKVITVTFNNNGGTGTTSLKGGIGDRLTLPANPVRTGYTFTGWDPSLPSYFPEGNKTYTAQWKINEVTITFDTDGGTSIASVKGNFGTAVTPPAANPTKANNTFTGWSPSIPSTFPAANLTITAQWKINQTTVTFDSDGGTPVASKTGNIGSTLAAPANPVKIGYSFTGWSPALPSKFPEVNSAYKAQWVKIDPSTITFNTDGGSDITAITGLYGAAVTAPADPTKAGYTFAGWTPAIPSTFPENSMTVKALWTKNRITITFDTAGGTAVAPIKGYVGTNVTAPANPTKTGFTFAGWTPALPDTYPTANLTVTATWTANP